MSHSILYFALTTIIFNCTLGITDEQKLSIQKEFIAIGTECILKYPITIEDVKSFKSKQFPDNANAGCFTACVFNKSGIFDDEGKLSQKTAVENSAKILDEETELENLQQFFTVCDKVNEENVNEDSTEKGCERAKLAFECLIENSEQFGFNFDF